MVSFGQELAAILHTWLPFTWSVTTIRLVGSNALTRVRRLTPIRDQAGRPLPGIIESFAYMRGVLAGMGYHG
jgi:hypothetical protein